MKTKKDEKDFIRRTAFKVVMAAIASLALLLAWGMRKPATVAVIPAASLPSDFIWGVSSSAFQSEGGEVNSNWELHKKPPVDREPYGTSVDFRHRYREDVTLAKQLGVNTYRIGINWARVEPKKGKIDAAELAYYDDLILALKQAGITPLITLDHFIYPSWVSAQGAWTNPQTTTDFVKYSRLIAERYREDVHLWITFNETAFYMFFEIDSRQMGFKDFMSMRKNLISAHRQTYDVIHQVDKQAVVTSNIVWVGDHFGSALLRQFTNWMFFNGVKDKCDVIAIDYYTADLITAARTGHHWKWPPQPAGLYRALKMLKSEFPDKPILIAEVGMATENGQAREDGAKREDVLRDGVYWTQRAKADGVNVIGYMVWSLTDNYEWGSYTPRFGLYTVNVRTDASLTRIPTAAVPAYQEVIRNAGVGADYQPVLPQ
ncbi:glycoside hydrolase family 1 protein [Stenotrophobium rhamnosiphilum]|uniref:Glycoside hydrolase family 1 n=1 Tax=Stenotrophobium rhamnosiphilum TaxID=2029166 RepID=A0A2T5MH79_9GAMM|nr:family 1 glycosylhydrolase [Stenotrophobium rhamnosiphilum]PTU31899.1 glycoside hydrolase family 1 [Stenotrophobium rhamnosiphilum]